MEEENKVETKKKDNYWIVTVIVLAMIILGMGGYVTYDKVVKPEQKEKEPVESQSEEESFATITDEELNNLMGGLITSDKELSLYGDKKVSSEESGNEFILYNVYNYMNENNIKPTPGSEPSHGTKVSKEAINKYINEKYNTTIKYDLPLASDVHDPIGEIGCLSIYSLDAENYSLVYIGKTCGDNHIVNKLVDKEETKDELIVYSNVVGCYSELQSVDCRKGIDINSPEQLFSCSYESEYNENCPESLDYSKGLSLDEYADYVLNNMSDKLRTYKVTYKKVDGNYYFVSSEISNG